MKTYKITVFDEVFKVELSGDFDAETKKDAIIEACDFWEISKQEIKEIKEVK